MLEVLKDKNAWLQNYVGQTLDDRLKEEMLTGLFEEHSKYKADVKLKTILDKCDLTLGQKDQILEVLKQSGTFISQSLGKKCICTFTEKGVIKSVAGSSLIKDTITGEIYENIITDQFGLFLQMLSAASAVSIKNSAGGNSTYASGAGCGGNNNNFNYAFSQGKWEGRYGTNTDAAVQSDYKIKAALTTGSMGSDGNYIFATANAYSNITRRLTFNIDLNPPGGTDTAYEIISGSAMRIKLEDSGTEHVTFTRDLLSGGVAYSPSGLLRTSFAFQLS